MRLLMPLCTAGLMLLAGIQLGCGRSSATNDSSQSTTPELVEQTEAIKEVEQQTSDADKSRSKPHVYDRVVALLVGIDKYQSPGIRELSSAEQDASALADVLSSRYGYEPNLLVGAQASKRAVLGEIDRLGNALGENDALIVYFAGHGDVVELPSIEPPDYGTKGFLVPHDAELSLEEKQDAGKWADEAIDMTELLGTLGRMRARHVLLIADCCCSGFLTKRGGFASRTDLPELVSMPSRIVLAATTSTQQADDGLFTQKLLGELKRSEAAGVTDLFLPLRRSVCAQNRHMTPQMSHFGVGAGEFVFIPLEEPAERVEIAMAQVVSRAAERVSQQTQLSDLLEASEALDYRNSLSPAKGRRLWETKFERLQQNAAISDPLALAGLYYAHVKGLGTEKDNDKANRFAVLANQTGHAAGKHVLGACLLFGVGAEQNPPAAIRLFEEASSAGFPISKLTLAHMTLYRATSPEERRRGLSLFNEAIGGGVTSARVQLALALSGIESPYPGVEINVREAVRVLRPALDAGHPAAGLLMFQIVETHDDTGVELDSGEALDWLTSSASTGLPAAQVQLAKLYMNVKDKHGVPFAEKYGLTPNDPKLVDWLQLAARQDNAESHYMLSVLYEAGKVTPRNLSKAFEHTERAAELGHPRGKTRLAICYEQEYFGTKQDLHKAFNLFQEAAALGEARACLRLGLMYNDRVGIPDEPPWRARALAAHWLCEALRRGSKSAEGIFDEVEIALDERGWRYLEEQHPESAGAFRRYARR